MGLFDWFSRSKATTSLSPEVLKQELFDAVQMSDWNQLAMLCRTHQDAILQHYQRWQSPGAENLPTDPAAIQQYIQFLGHVADYFTKHLGRPELWQMLAGTEETNPLLRWDKVLRQAEAFWEQLRFQEAIDLLNDHLIDVRTLKGSGADELLPKTYGHLGCSYFHSGQVEKSITPLEGALELCIGRGDVEGELTYLGNLYQAHRYLGHPDPAADYAERLASVHAARGNEAEAAWYRKQSFVVRAGEPLNRMVAVIAGRRFELDEVPRPGLEDRVEFQFWRNRISLLPAQVLTAEGDMMGSKGQHEEALAAFRAAAHTDCHDPQPYYKAGVTQLCLHRYMEATESFQIADELAPGWFYCRRYLWLAEQMRLGRLDQVVFLATIALDEDAAGSPEDKVQLAEQTLTVAPDVAWLHLLLGRNLNTVGRSKEAEAALRKGLACANEPDVKTSLLCELGHKLGASSEEGSRLLHEAVELQGNLLAATAASFVLKWTES